MKPVFVAILSLLAFAAGAQNFEDFFSDATLRIDYMLCGNQASQSVCLDTMSKLPQWAGRKKNLSQVPVQGNSTVSVRDKESKQLIYTTSFSSLFQEWLSEDEAKTVSRAMEHVVLVPWPKKEVEVTVELRNNRNEVTASITHAVNPADILISDRSRDFVPAHRYLVRSGSLENCIDIAILAEGYTESEMNLFYADAQKAVDALFSHEPFTSNKNRFNIVAVATPSRDSNVSIPRNGLWRNTACNSNFDTFYSARYLTTGSLKKVNDHLAAIPYEHIIILANTDTYGGGGIYNSYMLTTAHHEMFQPVIVHEFGHSFCGLGDEYFYESEPSSIHQPDIEPWEPNITTLVDFESKWKDMLDPKTPVPTTKVPSKEPAIYEQIGVYEGAGYCTKGVYRPVDQCRMRNNTAPGFCPVCRRAIERAIKFYTE